MQFISPGHSGKIKVNVVVWLLPVGLLGLLLYIVIGALKGEKVPPPQPPTADGGAFPRTITEPNGRKVTIPAKPVRILPCDAGSADIVTALVEPNRIVAMTGTVDSYGGALEFYVAHPEITRFQKFSAEPVLSLKPDLVLVASYQDATSISVIESHGIPVLKFESFRTFEGIRGSILAIGGAVGEDEKAQALAADFDKRLKAVETAIGERKRPRALAYSNFSGQGFAVGSGESQDEILRRAGAVNAATEMKLAGHVNFSFEQMLKLNPDVIVVGGDKGLESGQVRMLLNEPALAELSAIKQRRIAVVPDRYFSAISQYIVKAVEILARQIHPDAFPAGVQ